MRSSELINNELEALTKARQAVNKAMSRANRKKGRVSQRAGSLILEVPAALRGRVLAVFDAIVADEKVLARCERVIMGGSELSQAAE